MSIAIEKVLLSGIDFENNFYKLSKNPPDSKLRASIKNSGILDLPLLLRGAISGDSGEDSRGSAHYDYIILFGHNRLRIVKELEYESVDALVADHIDPYTFLKYALLKNCRSEIGPIARIKLIAILKYNLNFGDDAIASICRSDLNVPDFFYTDDAIIKSIINLPTELKDYIDNRGIGYKVIKGILNLGSEYLYLLNSWVKHINFRVNYFKDIVDCIVDIGKRRGGMSSIKSIDIDSIECRRNGEEYVYSEVFKIRYPEYSRMIAKADDMITELKRVGVDVDFPRYFERDSITIKVSVGKREGADKLGEVLKRIDRRAIEKLLDLL
jgi:hypothetical protein